MRKHFYIYVNIAETMKTRYARGSTRAFTRQKKFMDRKFSTPIASFLALFLLAFSANAQIATDTASTTITQNSPTFVTLLGLTANTIQGSQAAVSAAAVKEPIFSDGDVLNATLLSVLILLHIFGGLHNMLIGVKIKKTQYD